MCSGARRQLNRAGFVCRIIDISAPSTGTDRRTATMFAQLSRLSSLRLAALAVALMLGDGLAAAKPASADVVEWQRQQQHWTHQSNGWNRQWRNQWHHRNQFNTRSQVIIGGGPGIIVVGPGFVVGNPGIIVRRPNVIWQRPQFAWKQKQFFKRHPSLHVGQPWWHKNWKNKHWKHNSHWKHNNHWKHDNHWKHNNWRHNGMRFTTPGMRFTTPGMRFTTP